MTTTKPVRVYGLPPQFRAEAQEQAGRMRQAANDAAAFVRSLGSIPADSITAVQFAEFRRTTAMVLLEAGSCLDNTAVMLDVLAAMNCPVADATPPVPCVADCAAVKTPTNANRKSAST